MISTEVLQPCRTIADQLGDLLLESYGAVDLVFAETGASSITALAAATWCQDFSLRTPSAALVDLADLAGGEIRLRYARQEEYNCDLQAPALFERVAAADVVVLDGVDLAARRDMPSLLKFLGRCAWRSRLTVAPVSLAAPFIRHPVLCHLRMAADELIPTDVVSNQRAALIAASFIRQSGEGSES